MDVKYPPPPPPPRRVCLSIYPDRKACGTVRCLIECLFVMTLLLGPGPRLADALNLGLNPVHFGPMLQQFRIADLGHSGGVLLKESPCRLVK